jgi:hypothetical protein
MLAQLVTSAQMDFTHHQRTSMIAGCQLIVKSEYLTHQLNYLLFITFSFASEILS